MILMDTLGLVLNEIVLNIPGREKEAHLALKYTVWTDNTSSSSALWSHNSFSNSDIYQSSERFLLKNAQIPTETHRVTEESDISCDESIF